MPTTATRAAARVRERKCGACACLAHQQQRSGRTASNGRTPSTEPRARSAAADRSTRRQRVRAARASQPRGRHQSGRPNACAVTIAVRWMCEARVRTRAARTELGAISPSAPSPSRLDLVLVRGEEGPPPPEAGREEGRRGKEEAREDAPEATARRDAAADVTRPPDVPPPRRVTT